MRSISIMVPITWVIAGCVAMPERPDPERARLAATRDSRIEALERVFEPETRLSFEGPGDRVRFEVPGGALELEMVTAHPELARLLGEGAVTVTGADIQGVAGLGRTGDPVELAVEDVPSFLADENERSLCGTKKLVLMAVVYAEGTPIPIALEAHMLLEGESVGGARAALVSDGGTDGGDGGAGDGGTSDGGTSDGGDAGADAGDGGCACGSSCSCDGGTTTPPPTTPPPTTPPPTSCTGWSWFGIGPGCSGSCPPEPNWATVDCEYVTAGWGMLSCACRHHGLIG
jgi:hypothetical protein